MPVIAKSIHIEKQAKPARLSSLYLYRMHKFNKAKAQLDKLPAKLFRAKRKYISNYAIPISDYHLARASYFKVKVERLEKRLANLSPKLGNQEKLSSFVQKQVEIKELGFWKSTLHDMKNILTNSLASMGGAIGFLMLASYAAESIAPGTLQGISPAHAITQLAIFGLSVAVGIRLYGMAENARGMLEIGKEKAEKLAEDVKKLAS